MEKGESGTQSKLATSSWLDTITLQPPQLDDKRTNIRYRVLHSSVCPTQDCCSALFPWGSSRMCSL